MATSRGENKNKNKEIAIKFDFYQILSLSLLSGVLMSRTLFLFQTINYKKICINSGGKWGGVVNYI
ncbi:hypothetical protein CW668_01085 [Macrococcoides caseolyticum]|nr:hypothetical protein CW668_01085 [Macrococcus caseolyticus]